MLWEWRKRTRTGGVTVVVAAISFDGSCNWRRDLQASKQASTTRSKSSSSLAVMMLFLFVLCFLGLLLLSELASPGPCWVSHHHHHHHHRVVVNLVSIGRK
jgi:lysylphosphatidylglycerol synthetase-like protein (DUF2156 family)